MKILAARAPHSAVIGQLQGHFAAQLASDHSSSFIHPLRLKRWVGGVPLIQRTLFLCFLLLEFPSSPFASVGLPLSQSDAQLSFVDRLDWHISANIPAIYWRPQLGNGFL